MTRSQQSASINTSHTNQHVQVTKLPLFPPEIRDFQQEFPSMSITRQFMSYLVDDTESEKGVSNFTLNEDKNYYVNPAPSHIDKKRQENNMYQEQQQTMAEQNPVLTSILESEYTENTSDRRHTHYNQAQRQSISQTVNNISQIRPISTETIIIRDEQPSTDIVMDETVKKEISDSPKKLVVITKPKRIHEPQEQDQHTHTETKQVKFNQSTKTQVNTNNVPSNTQKSHECMTSVPNTQILPLSIMDNMPSKTQQSNQFMTSFPNPPMLPLSMMGQFPANSKIPTFFSLGSENALPYVLPNNVQQYHIDLDDIVNRAMEDNDKRKHYANAVNPSAKKTIRILPTSAYVGYQLALNHLILHICPNLKISPFIMSRELIFDIMFHLLCKMFRLETRQFLELSRMH